MLIICSGASCSPVSREALTWASSMLGNRQCCSCLEAKERHPLWDWAPWLGFTAEWRTKAAWASTFHNAFLKYLPPPSWPVPVVAEVQLGWLSSVRQLPWFLPHSPPKFLSIFLRRSCCHLFHRVTVTQQCGPSGYMLHAWRSSQEGKKINAYTAHDPPTCSIFEYSLQPSSWRTAS